MLILLRPIVEQTFPGYPFIWAPCGDNWRGLDFIGRDIWCPGPVPGELLLVLHKQLLNRSCS